MKILRWFETFRELESQCDMLHSKLMVQSAAVGRIAAERDDIRRQLDATTSELAVERNKRVSAEAIAVERGRTIERMDTEVKRANESRDAAISQRMATVDGVNSVLLGRIMPEINPDPVAAQATFKKVSELLPRKASKRESIDHQVDGELLAIHNKFRIEHQKATTTIDSQAG